MMMSNVGAQPPKSPRARAGGDMEFRKKLLLLSWQEDALHGKEDEEADAVEEGPGIVDGRNSGVVT